MKNSKHKSDNPLISVVIPVYNVSPYLERALDSLLSQTYINYLDLIAINDGSEDSSGEILDRYKQKYPQITVIHQQNFGLSATRNTGLKQAKGKYIYFFDSDDMLVENAFEILLTKAEIINCDLISFAGKKIDEYDMDIKNSDHYLNPDVKIPTPGEDLFNQLMKSNQYTSGVPFIFFRKDFLTRNQLTFTEGFIHEDEAFTAKAFCLAEKAVSLSHQLYKRRIRSNSIMSRVPRIDNIEGKWRACFEILTFLNKTKIKNLTRQSLLYRARIIAHSAIIHTKAINKKIIPDKIKNEDFIDNNSLDQLGFEVKLHMKSSFLFKVWKLLGFSRFYIFSF